ncbi:MAG: BamA/TamA family outer membrane protein [Candidatus Latescibacteria bacterium]|nr:BamA/TamA family outer membrane protein [Candidatus Latescibacterota bacterium]
MRCSFARGTVACLALWAAVGSGPVEPRAAAQARFDVDAYRWAQGRIIDTVYVHGNTRVKTFAVLREMESQPGHPLDAVAVDRDQRYLGDLSPFATVAIHVEPVGEDRCVLSVVVKERPTLLLKFIYPVLDYDINTERILYGLKWFDRNFRRRLENFSLEFLRDNRENDSASAQWSTAWIGWRHVGAGARLSYFNRGEPASETTIIKQTRAAANVSIPLTERRIAFSQIISGVAIADNHVGLSDADFEREELLSPSLGFRYDGRDGTVKPRRGGYFYVNVAGNRVLNGEGSTYYRVDNDIRYFRALDATTVLGVRSQAAIQIGEFPDYIRFGIGGPGTIRGYERSDFRSTQRWVQSLELRMMPWPKRLYKLPILGTTDFQFGVVAFIDTGIGWTHEAEFNLDNFHSGFGFGLRLFSPIQDVIRVDVGFTPQGDIRPYFTTGSNF